VYEPQSGRAELSSVEPALAVRKWPGAVAYVPQSVSTSNASIRENVALGLPPSMIDDCRVWEALERAMLAADVSQWPEGLDAAVGERGTRLSGGQRQRLGVARALYTRPRLIVLDEATSALDAETEFRLGEMLERLRGEMTLVLVAHRLSTIRHADNLIYLDKGRVLGTGAFDELRNRIPRFDEQARMMGL
jgi:ABC-type multidrug transport system fused ATPase/permease subunit